MAAVDLDVPDARRPAWIAPGHHKHTPELSVDEREALLASARDLAKTFDALGPGCDTENRFPVESVAAYKASGLAGMAVPRAYGGLGADIWTTALVGRELAKGDGGIALSYNMHQAMVGILRGTPALDEPARERLLRRVASENAILMGTFSEARAGLAGLADTVAIPEPGGGWRLRGRKNWSTLIEGCDVVTLNATITDADGNVPTDFRARTAAEALFIFDVGIDGVRVERTWDTLGMRATGSQTLVLEDAYVGPEAFGGNFRTGLVGEAEWAAICFGGVYLGLAERAYSECVAILRRKRLGATAAGDDLEVRQQGHVQHAVGRMKAELETAARTVESTAYLAIKDRPVPALAPVRKATFDLAKVVATEAGMFVTDQACRLVGGAAFARGHILERCFRDARGGVLHSFTTDQLYLMYGRSELGLLT